MRHDLPHDRICVALAATNRFAKASIEEVHDDFPVRSDDMHMSGLVVVGIDDEPETAFAQDRRHEDALT